MSSRESFVWLSKHYKFNESLVEGASREPLLKGNEKWLHLRFTCWKHVSISGQVLGEPRNDVNLFRYVLVTLCCQRLVSKVRTEERRSFTFSRHLERLSQWAFQAFKDSTSKFSFTLVSLCIGNNYKYCKLSRISNNVCGYCSSLSKTGDEFYSFVSRLTSKVTPSWENRIKFISYRKSNIANKTCCGKALLRCVSRYRFYSRPEFYFLKCPRHRSWQQM